jgi:hypothetical protein
MAARAAGGALPRTSSPPAATATEAKGAGVDRHMDTAARAPVATRTRLA